MSDTSESDLCEGSPNFTIMETKARKYFHTDHNLAKVADTVENIVKGKFRKSVISRAVHPSLISSTPCASEIIKDNSSFSNVSTLSDSSDQKKKQTGASMVEEVSGHQLSKNLTTLSDNMDKSIVSDNLEKSTHLSLHKKKVPTNIVNGHKVAGGSSLDYDIKNKQNENKTNIINNANNSHISNEKRQMTLKKGNSCDMNEKSDMELTMEEDQLEPKIPKRKSKHLGDKHNAIDEYDTRSQSKRKKVMKIIEENSSVSEFSSGVLTDNSSYSHIRAKKKEKIKDKKIILLKPKTIEDTGKGRTRSLSRPKKSYIKYAYVTEDSDSNNGSNIKYKKKKTVRSQSVRKKKNSSSELSDDSIIINASNELIANVETKKKRPRRTVIYVEDNPTNQRIQKGRSLSRKRNEYFHDWGSKDEIAVKEALRKRHLHREKRTRLIEVTLSDSDIIGRVEKKRVYHKNIPKSSNRIYNQRDSQDRGELIDNLRRAPSRYYEPAYSDVAEKIYGRPKSSMMLNDRGCSRPRRTHTSQNRRDYSPEDYRRDSSEFESNENFDHEKKRGFKQNMRLSRRDSYILEKKIKKNKRNVRSLSKKNHEQEESSSVYSGCNEQIPDIPQQEIDPQQQSFKTMVVGIINDHLNNLKNVCSFVPLNEPKMNNIHKTFDNINEACIANNEKDHDDISENEDITPKSKEFIGKINNSILVKPEELEASKTIEDSSLERSSFNERTKISRKLARQPFKKVDGIHEYYFPVQKPRNKNKILKKKSLLKTVELLSIKHLQTNRRTINVGIQTSLKEIHNTPSSDQKYEIRIDDTLSNNSPSSVERKGQTKCTLKRLGIGKLAAGSVEQETEHSSDNKIDVGIIAPPSNENVVILQNITVQGAVDIEYKNEDEGPFESLYCTKQSNEIAADVPDNLVDLSPNSFLIPSRVPKKKTKKCDKENAEGGSDCTNKALFRKIVQSRTLELEEGGTEGPEEELDIGTVASPLNPNISSNCVLKLQNITNQAVEIENIDKGEDTIESREYTKKKLARKINETSPGGKVEANLSGNWVNTYPSRILNHKRIPKRGIQIQDVEEKPIENEDCIQKELAGKRLRSRKLNLEKVDTEQEQEVEHSNNTIVAPTLNEIILSNSIVIPPNSNYHTEGVENKGREKEPVETSKKGKKKSDVSDDLINSSPDGYPKSKRVLKKGTKKVPRAKLNLGKNEILELETEENSNTDRINGHVEASSEVSSSNTGNGIRKSTRERKRVETLYWTEKAGNESNTQQSVKKATKSSKKQSVKKATSKKKAISNVSESTTDGTESANKYFTVSMSKSSKKKATSDSESTTEIAESTQDHREPAKKKIKESLKKSNEKKATSNVSESTTKVVESITNISDSSTSFTGSTTIITESNKRRNSSSSKKPNKKRKTICCKMPKKATKKKNTPVKSPSKKKVRDSVNIICSTSVEEPTARSSVENTPGMEINNVLIYQELWQKTEMCLRQLGKTFPETYDTGENYGYLALPPKSIKKFINNNYEVAFTRTEGTTTTSLALEGVCLQEAPCFFVIPKGSPAAITNTGDERVVFFYVIKK